MAAAHTGAVAPAPLTVQNQMPAQTLAELTALRHKRLLAGGRDGAENGANVAQLRSGLHQETQYLNTIPEEGHFGRRLAAQSERTALAQLLHTDYSDVQRFTDGLATGNISYRGKAAVRANQAPDGDVPFFEEQECRPGRATLVRAAQHFDGMTQRSKFVSVTADVPSARRTPDPQLQATMA